MNNYTFVILRHVTKQLNNSDEIWKECYKSIRLFYNNKIIIIDNNSDYNIIKNDIELKNCEIINSSAFNSRLFSPFYELLNIDFERAIIIHDGVIFKKFVDFSKFEEVKFIWNFNMKQYDDINLIEGQLSVLKNNNILFDIFRKKYFVGCMGCCLAITKPFLMKLEEKYKISSLKNIIKNQQDAIAFERTISVLCFSEKPNLINDISFEGEIKHMIWGYSYLDFINNKKYFQQKEWDTNKNVVIDISNKSIIKIFGARK
jgi:hypothetical protein